MRCRGIWWLLSGFNVESYRPETTLVPSWVVGQVSKRDRAHRAARRCFRAFGRLVLISVPYRSKEMSPPGQTRFSYLGINTSTCIMYEETSYLVE
jgi:hypothetical protein